MKDLIKVQEADFNIQDEYDAIRADNQEDGAIVFFSGLVRDFNQGNDVTGLFLEHYPAMTEKALGKIVDEAKERWPINRVRLIHRVGQLYLADQIVFVAVSSKHREAAFDACRFIMDFLKVKATFWKKEVHANGQKLWLDAKQSDQNKANSW